MRFVVIFNGERSSQILQSLSIIVHKVKIIQ